MPRPQTIIPAIIPESAVALQAILNRLHFLHEIQIDVVDGDFVSSISWPYEPSGTPDVLRPVLAPFSVEVDLMTTHPYAAGQVWLAAGATQLVFHIETIEHHDLQRFVSRYPEVSVGISANNDTPWEVCEPYLSLAEYVQLMGIATIGSQGQPFDERVLARIAQVRAVAPDMTISIDGSVNSDTIPTLRAAGADRLVVGSALLRADDWHAQYTHLDTLARPQA